MPSRNPNLITSEREAWAAVKRQAQHLLNKFVTPHRANEVGFTIEGIADNMLTQLGTGIHANPFVLWGRPKGSTNALDDQPLTTRETMREIEFIKGVASKDGWHSFYVQNLDGSIPGFAGTVRRGRGRKR